MKQRFLWIAILAMVVIPTASWMYISRTQNIAALPRRQLPNTADIAAVGEHSFSLSPDGNWLTYPSQHGTPFSPVHMLYHIPTQQSTKVQLNARANQLASEGLGSLQQPACWDTSSSTITLPGNGVLFVADVRATPAVFEVKEDVGATALQAVFECNTAQPVNVQAVQRGQREVALVAMDKSQQVVAVHETRRRSSDRIAAGRLALSFDHALLAYTIEEYNGTFTRGSLGYVLPLNTDSVSMPHYLGTSILGPLHWSRQERVLYGCVQEEDGTVSIYRWEIKL